MGFSPIPARPAPAEKRAPEKERSDNEHLRNRNRADHQPAGTGCSPVETALERSGSAAQPRVEEAISRCEFLPAVGDQVHLALLAHPQAGERAWRIGAEGRQSQIVVFWRVDHISNSEAEPDPEKLEADEKSRRRFVLRYYRLWVRREVA